MATLRGFAKLLDFPSSHMLPAYWRKLLILVPAAALAKVAPPETLEWLVGDSSNRTNMVLLFSVASSRGARNIPLQLFKRITTVRLASQKVASQKITLLTPFTTVTHPLGIGLPGSFFD
jgi:hypothetical protein